MLAPSLELVARLQERIADLDPTVLAEETVSETLLRLCKQELHALPIHAGPTELWALRPDGALLCVDHGTAPPHVDQENDPQRAYAALVRGAARYPELEEIVAWCRVAFLASRGRTYPASEVHPEQRAEAVATGRVLRVHGGVRAFGSGDVWFTVATPDVSDADVCRDGMIYPEPIRPGQIPERDSYDATWEYWRLRNEWDLEGPCGRMTGHQRTRYRQAVAGFVARLLGFTPLAVRAGTAPYRELLRRYAAVDPDSSRDLGLCADDCARSTGNRRLLFDPDHRFERDGSTAPALSFMNDFPRALGEYLLSEIVAETYPNTRTGSHHIIQPAETWLRDTVRAWLADAAWTIQAGEEMPPPALDSPDALPPVLRDFGPWAIPEPPERLHEIIARLDDTAAEALCRRSLRVLLLPSLLDEPPAGTPAMAALLETARQWAESPDPRVTGRAQAMAEDTTHLGGDSLYGVPFQILTLRTPAEVAALVEATVRTLARRRYRRWTNDTAPPDIADTAAAAAREDLRRHIQQFLLPRGGE